MSFNNKVIIVTGASSGIGAAIAIKFAEEGAKLVIVGRNEIKLKKTVARCKTYGVEPLSVVADLNKDEDVKKIVNTTVNHFSKIDILVNNAGIAESAAIYDEKAMETFDRVISTNFRSVVLLTNLASQHLIKAKGNIVNVSSTAAMDVLGPQYFAYCSSKAGVDHFTRAAALDFAPKGVRMNSVNPGPVLTEIFDTLGLEGATKEGFLKNLAKGTALGKLSEPEEVADLVLFLASDKAKSITGSSFVADNGSLLKRNLIPTD